MSENFSSNGKLRKEAFEKLKIFLANPGRFCLIVLGNRGTGKHYAIEKVFEEIKTTNNTELCLEGIVFEEPKNIPNNEKEIDELLAKFQYKTLVIEDVEELTSEQESMLFKVLSTTDGSFGINNKFKIRMVFTSNKDADLLREDGRYLTGNFWDRISQLIVEFPSYKHESESIVHDFKETWDKMKFEEIPEYVSLAGLPKNVHLEKFLEDNADKFDGGFRDLDKLACMYFNYRIFHYRDKRRINEDIEKKVVESIKSDFFTKSQLQGSSGNDESIFQIRPGFKMDKLLGQFKIQVRNWAKKEYGTIKKAEEKLGLGAGTMKNYVEGKVTKSQKTSK
jgi:hypothetical protein